MTRPFSCLSACVHCSSACPPARTVSGAVLSVAFPRPALAPPLRRRRTTALFALHRYYGNFRLLVPFIVSSLLAFPHDSYAPPPTQISRFQKNLRMPGSSTTRAVRLLAITPSLLLSTFKPCRTRIIVFRRSMAGLRLPCQRFAYTSGCPRYSGHWVAILQSRLHHRLLAVLRRP